MNDLTKEELEEIYFRLENAPKELEDKIKSMIDNYCDHEFKMVSHYNHIAVIQCFKCGKGLIVNE